ncbi:hypothetical protein CJF30_00007412 [Rutstroemia sp. NJR-2017a BBW]|nr:hypothetical protein CJF30_00007412 [Rutstroemia sp. NJR-2017a BBW]
MKSDLESCFYTGNESRSSNFNTNSAHCDSVVEPVNDVDGIIIDKDEEKNRPPEYYVNQEDEFDESEYMAEDYSNGSCLLFDSE